jgi:hypothetical protein
MSLRTIHMAPDVKQRTEGFDDAHLNVGEQKELPSSQFVCFDVSWSSKR